MDKWRLILNLLTLILNISSQLETINIFTGLSSFGGASVEPRRIEGLQIIEGIGAFLQHDT